MPEGETRDGNGSFVTYPHIILVTSFTPDCQLFCAWPTNGEILLDGQVLANWIVPLTQGAKLIVLPGAAFAMA